MSYSSILLNFAIDGPVEPLARAGIELAQRCGAALIGFCAADAPLPVTMAPEGAAIAAEIWQQCRDDIGQRQKSMRAEFEALAAGSVKTQWRNSIEYTGSGLLRDARMADLIVTAAAEGASTGDAYRTADPASLVLRAGRPVLVAAAGMTGLVPRKAAVAWKDTREARRAVADAVPMLALAREVAIVSVAADPDDWLTAGINDVAAFLSCHGIKSRTHIVKSDDESGSLADAVFALECDMIVSGAYGHSRLREWAFGGVTRSLLDTVSINRLMSN